MCNLNRSINLYSKENVKFIFKNNEFIFEKNEHEKLKKWYKEQLKEIEKDNNSRFIDNDTYHILKYDLERNYKEIYNKLF